MKNNDYLEICEIFDSISGEGLNAGKPATFIRFSGCNLNCDFCDTKYHNEKICSDNAKNLIYKFEKELKGKKFVVFTGGEPSIQNWDELQELIAYLANYGTQHIEIETNGLNLAKFVRNFENARDIVTFSADFKMHKNQDLNYLASAFSGYNLLSKNDCIKVVVKNLNDIDYAKMLADVYINTNVLISPCFGEISPTKMAEYIIEKKYQNIRLQLQMHKVLWEADARGR